MDEVSTEVRGTWVVPAGKSVSVARHLINEGQLIAGFSVSFQREPNNNSDRNAIAVHIHGNRIGYLPRDLSARLASYLDAGGDYEARITSVGKHKHWDGSTYPRVSLRLTFQGMQKPEKLDDIRAVTRQFNGLCGVYKIYNTKEQKSYIGSSTDIGRRLRSHIKDFHSGLHTNPDLMGAWNRHGPASFHLELLEQTPKENFEKREQFYIRKNNAYTQGYNLTPDGRGRKKTDAIRAVKQKKRRNRHSYKNIRYLITGLALVLLWILIELNK